MKYGYIRVSTQEQNEVRQLKALEKQGIRKSLIFIDKATGKNFNRPSYQSLKSEIKKGDEIYIISVDRLGRNKEQCLKELRDLKEKGVIIRILDIPTSLINVDEKNISMIEMINNILIEVYTTLAEEELNRIKKRQKEGIEAMEEIKDNGKMKKLGKKGVVVGRPSININNISKEDLKRIKSWIDKKIKYRDVEKLTGMKKTTLYKLRKEIKDNK